MALPEISFEVHVAKVILFRHHIEDQGFWLQFVSYTDVVLGCIIFCVEKYTKSNRPVTMITFGKRYHAIYDYYHKLIEAYGYPF